MQHLIVLVLNWRCEKQFVHHFPNKVWIVCSFCFPLQGEAVDQLTHIYVNPLAANWWLRLTPKVLYWNTCSASMKSVVCAGVASGVTWEDAKEGRCAFRGVSERGSTVYLPWYCKFPTTDQRSVTRLLTASECCSCKPQGAVVKGCIQL